MEAILMRDVYRNASFYIAATAANDGTHGLFRDRDCSAFSPFQITGRQRFAPSEYWCMIHPDTSSLGIDSAPLNQRAWVAQERYLSPRTIHFTTT